MTTSSDLNSSARSRARRLTATFAILATLSAGILIGSILTRSVSGKEQVDSSDARPLSVPAPVTMPNDFTRIAKQISPAVVNINTVTIPKAVTNRTNRRGPLQLNPSIGIGNNGGNEQGDMGDLFRRFFGDGNGDDGADDQGGPEREARGSGFIVDPRGY